MFNNQTLYDRPMRVKMDSTAAKKPEIPLPCKCIDSIAKRILFYNKWIFKSLIPFVSHTLTVWYFCQFAAGLKSIGMGLGLGGVPIQNPQGSCAL